MPWIAFWGAIGTIFLPDAFLWWLTAEWTMGSCRSQRRNYACFTPERSA